MKPHLLFLELVAVAVLGLAFPCEATLIIDVGTIELQPDLPGQLAELVVSGGDPVEGMNFNLQVADGGTAAGGTVVGPSVTADLVHGTIFASNFVGPFNIEPSPLPMVELWTIITQSGTVAANGTLARLTFDTAGLFEGEFPLLFTGTINGDTDFIDVVPTIQNGIIRIVPEPTILLVTSLLSGLVWFRRYRAKAGPVGFSCLPGEPAR